MTRSREWLLRCFVFAGLLGGSVAGCGDAERVETTTAGIGSRAPVGYFEAADANGLAGWACDPDEPATAVVLHIYDGSTLVGVTPAGMPRSDVASSCGGTTNHGFSWRYPESLRDGRSHTISVYALNVPSGGTNPPLTWSPRSVTIPAAAVPKQGLLWNPGPRWRAFRHQNNSTGGCNAERIAEMSEGDRDGNEANACPTFLCKVPNGSGTTAVPRTAPDGSCASVAHVTYEWTPADLGRYPGWDVWHMSGGGGTPMEIRLHNNAYGVPGDPCLLREVSTSYTNNPLRPGVDSFRYELRTNDFNDFTGVFAARLVSSAGPPRCKSNATGYVTSDFGVMHLDAANRRLRADVTGVLVSNPWGGDLSGTPDDAVYFFNNCTQGSDLCITLLHGSKLGLPALGTSYTSYAISYKALMASYLPPPPAGTVKSVVYFWEVYSSVRGADLVFDVKDMDLLGESAGPERDTCVVKGGVCNELSVRPNVSRQECAATCDSFASHSNRKCTWGSRVLRAAPTRDHCTIRGGAGAWKGAIANASRCECLDYCLASAALGFGRMCTWRNADSVDSNSLVRLGELDGNATAEEAACAYGSSCAPAIDRTYRPKECPNWGGAPCEGDVTP